MSMQQSDARGMRPQRYVGASIFYFRIQADGTIAQILHPDQDQNLTEALKASSGNASATLLEAAYSPARLAHLKVTVSVFLSDSGRLVCGSVNVATVPDSGTPEFEDIEPASIGVGIWRQLRIGELTERAIIACQAVVANLGSKLPADALTFYKDVASRDRVQAKPGPKTALTPEILRTVVRPAYLAGGRKGLQAVQRALEEAGYPASTYDGKVTNDQARAAVRKARKLGLIPPARRKDAP